MGVQRGGPATYTGSRESDIIFDIYSYQVSDQSDMRNAAEYGARLHVQRGNGTVFSLIY